MKNYHILWLAAVLTSCHSTNKPDTQAVVKTNIADTAATNHPDQVPDEDTAQDVSAAGCQKTWLATIEQSKVWKLEQGAVYFEAKMAIDADGSPRAYCPDNQGLDYTANAGNAGNWWGIVTDQHGEPVIQKDSDPCPGCYVSPTTLYDKTRSKDNPLRYCNSEQIPFIVLPKKVMDLGGIRIGDLAYVFNTGNRKSCFALFADGGPAGKLGEGSIYLAERLAVNSNARRGGASGGIIYLVFPRSGKGNGYLPSLEEINQAAAKELQKLGGESIIGCLGF